MLNTKKWLKSTALSMDHDTLKINFNMGRYFVMVSCIILYCTNIAAIKANLSIH